MTPVPFNDILTCFYPEDTPLKRLLLTHSRAVARKALACRPDGLSPAVIETGAMLHDIGIFLCHAPGIHCCGPEPYLRHGLLGGQLLRQFAREHHLYLEPYARICERHTGSGLTSDEIIRQSLPLPPHDFLPETPLEKLICYADTFFSKSGDETEKPLPKIQAQLAAFGPAPLERFNALHALFTS